MCQLLALIKSFGFDNNPSILKRLAPAKKRKLHTRLKTMFNRNEHFLYLEEREILCMIDALAPVKFSKSDVVYNGGDNIGEFYYVQRGELDMFNEGELVGTLREGDTFGELDIIHGPPTNLTVVAKKKCKLWFIDRNVYGRIVMQSVFKKNESFKEFVCRVGILGDLQRECISLDSVDIPAGNTVIEEGEPGNDFYIIMEGQALVLQKRRDKNLYDVVERLGSTDYFGELAVLLERPHVATVVAKTNLKLIKVSSHRLEAVLGKTSGPLKASLGQYMRSYSIAV